jgi:RHS repeat-associated protein
VNAGKPDAIREIHYNVKGQKTFLKLGNDAITRYTYDPNTFRLTHLFTRRAAGFTGDCASGTASGERPQRPCGVQNLHYTYDPVGNITHIQDDAQQTIFFAGAMVEPSNNYVYDALYRLITATGRETAQGGDAARDSKDADYAHGFPVTDQTLRNYTESYAYDSVGNFISVAHAIQGDPTNSWTRQYAYAFDDSTQPASNRLWHTWTGTKEWDHTPVDKRTEYLHDTHGNMLNLASTDPQFNMRWDHRDMIGNIDLGGGGQAYYQYDAGKQRTRKRIERNPPDTFSHTIKEERIYLGGYELYRRYTGDPNDPIEEIESHHIFEGQQRVLLVDDVLTAGGSSHPRPDGLPVAAQTLFRYQYGNHLGSACLELDDHAAIISYEEYHPYGTSAYRAMNSTIEAPPKRYRYTGMERDEESGLNYHGARYYVPGLQRWSAFDPAQLDDGINGYVYSRNNPVMRVDPGGMTSSPSNCELPSRPAAPRPKARPPAPTRHANFGAEEITIPRPPKRKQGPILDPDSLADTEKFLRSQKPTLNDHVPLGKGERLDQTRYPWMSSNIPEKTPEERKEWYKKRLGPYEAQLRESADRHHVPVQLLAAVILNELADIDWRDLVQEEIHVEKGSVGVAQIQIDTAIKDNLIPGVTDAAEDHTDRELRTNVSVALKIPQISIDAAAKEIHLVLEAAGKNPEGPWQRKFDYPFFITQPPDDPQTYYDFVPGGDPLFREMNLAFMIAAGYNSPDITKTHDLTRYEDGAILHGKNARFIAKDLAIFGLFRAQR